jgi:hypothetical protein
MSSISSANPRFTGRPTSDRPSMATVNLSLGASFGLRHRHTGITIGTDE